MTRRRSIISFVAGLVSLGVIGPEEEDKLLSMELAELLRARVRMSIGVPSAFLSVTRRLDSTGGVYGPTKELREVGSRRKFRRGGVDESLPLPCTQDSDFPLYVCGELKSTSESIIASGL